MKHCASVTIPAKLVSHVLLGKFFFNSQIFDDGSTEQIKTPQNSADNIELFKSSSPQLCHFQYHNDLTANHTAKESCKNSSTLFLKRSKNS